MLTPYIIKLVTLDVNVILVLLSFSGKVTTQLRLGKKFQQICVQIIPDHAGESVQKLLRWATIWPQYTWPKNCGLLCPFPCGSWVPI